MDRFASRDPEPDDDGRRRFGATDDEANAVGDVVANGRRPWWDRDGRYEKRVKRLRQVSGVVVWCCMV